MATTTYRPARVGPCTPAETVTNRQQWRKQFLAAPAGDFVVPDGVINADEAFAWPPRPRERGPLRVVSSGGSTLVNVRRQDSFPANCSVAAFDPSWRWADGFTRTADPRAVALDPSAVGSYPPGTPVYSSTFDGFYGDGMHCRRHVVVGVSGNTVVLDSEPDGRANVLKAVPGYLAESAPAGATRIKLLGGGPYPALMTHCRVTCGPADGNELAGEERDVVAVDGDTITIDRPLSFTWDNPVVAVLPALVDVTVEGLTFGAPPHPDAPPLFLKGADRFRLVDCQLGEPWKVAQLASINTAGHVELVRCRGTGVAFNTVSGLRLEGCDLGSVTLEEWVIGLVIRDLALTAAPPNTPGFRWVNGLQAILKVGAIDSIGLVLRGHDGSGAPMIGSAPGSTFTRTRITDQRGGSGIWWSEPTVWDGLDTTQPLMVASPDTLILNSRLRAGIDFRQGARGRCVNVDAPQGQRYPAEGWEWLASSPALPMPADQQAVRAADHADLHRHWQRRLHAAMPLRLPTSRPSPRE